MLVEQGKIYPVPDKVMEKLRVLDKKKHKYLAVLGIQELLLEDPGEVDKCFTRIKRVGICKRRLAELDEEYLEALSQEFPNIREYDFYKGSMDNFSKFFIKITKKCGKRIK